MHWTKERLKEARRSAKLSQSAIASELGIHFRTVQNWEKGLTPIPTSALPALDLLFDKSDDMVTKEEYNKIVDALNSANELNRKLLNIIQSNKFSDE